MTNKEKFQPDDLVVVVWPRQSQPLVAAGQMTWQDAVSADWARWAIDADKAQRARVLLAVHDDVIEGAWDVTGVQHHPEIPVGKTRTVNRTHFDTAANPLLAYLVGTPSPLPRRRNPQATMELRDLAGATALLAPTGEPTHGVVHLGAYSLVVSEDGKNVEVRIKPETVLTVRILALAA